MKKIIPCLIGGVVLGAGATLGITQIPSVNSSLFKDTNSSYEDTSLESENSDLKLNNSVLKDNLEKLNSELESCNNLIKEKDETILSHITQIEQLTAEKNQLQSINDKLQDVDIPTLTNENIALKEENADLKAELDTYKNLSGSDADYLDIIANLESELETKNTALNSANAELEQLKVDKTSLEIRVQELETELEKVKEELKKFKDNENIDKLNVSSFNGTWYLSGTFEKYFIIEDGVVTFNANEDNGVIHNLYNQMYLFMNTNGSIPVTLSDDGYSFTTESGDIYQRFYINTTETVLSNFNFCGTYSYSDEKIELNADNTLTYIVGDNTYYGAYTVVAEKTNIGGNICIKDTITATIQIDGVSVQKEFIYSSNNSSVIVCGDTSYSLISVDNAYVLSNSAFNVPSSYYKVRIKTRNPLTILPGSKVQLKASVEYQNPSYYDSHYYNGIGGSSGVELPNSTNETIVGSFFDIYLSVYSSSTHWRYTWLSDFVSLGGVVCDIVSVENVGMSESTYPLYGRLLDCLKNNNSSDNFEVVCNKVDDYINGTYFNDDISVNLQDGTSTITYTGTESITASDVNISAKTDGYDIYHEVTIVYNKLELVDGVETEVSHTIVLEFENDNLTNSLLDDELIEL